LLRDRRYPLGDAQRPVGCAAPQIGPTTEVLASQESACLEVEHLLQLHYWSPA
jgi:hypothetical protein